MTSINNDYMIEHLLWICVFHIYIGRSLYYTESLDYICLKINISFAATVRYIVCK